ncbi:hypothetical protein ACLOJK_013893 [Asimina triloba]
MDLASLARLLPTHARESSWVRLAKMQVERLGKDRRDEKRSEIKSAMAELSVLKEEGNFSTRPFLNLCTLVMQVLDKIGPTMAVLRQDMHQNIQSLSFRASFCLTNFTSRLFGSVIEVGKNLRIGTFFVLEFGGDSEERDGGRECQKSSELYESPALAYQAGSRDTHLYAIFLTAVSCSRSMDFAVALLDSVAKDPGKNLAQAVEESYSYTLKPWHGWISSAAYKVALKLVPENKAFIGLLMAQGEDSAVLKEEINSLVSAFLPLLEEIHTTLRLTCVPPSLYAVDNVCN